MSTGAEPTGPDRADAGGQTQTDATIGIEVAYATPERQTLLTLRVAAGCTVGQAIEASGIRDLHPDLRADPPAVGIFSRKVGLGDTLRDGDRVEIYRPLQADPRETRRRRAQRKRGS